MSNHTLDYNDNLVFMPTITWFELVEQVKEIYNNYCIIANDLEFFDTGNYKITVNIPCIKKF